MHDISSLKSRLQHSLDTIVTKHRNGASGTAIALALTRRLDSLVASVYADSGHPTKKQIALVALGGYGRKELNFASDTDIMFLARTQREKKHAAGAVKEILHALLDCGLEIGHSFRTIDECLEMAETEFDAWLSMLDARFLCGNRAVYARFRTSVATTIKRSDKQSFVRQLLAATNARHQKYGESAKLLEPNLKNSAGGLRDLHTVLWLLRGTGQFPLAQTSPQQKTSVSLLLASPAVKRCAGNRISSPARRGFEFLLRARNEMHLQAKGLHDTLEFTSQRKVAEALHYRNVERFMQDYYLAARSIARLSEQLTAWARETYLEPATKIAAQAVHPSFHLRDHTLEFTGRHSSPLTHFVLEASLLCAQHHARFSSSLEELFQRKLSSVRPIQTTDEARLFRRLLSSPAGVGRILQRLNDLGILGRLIPEWQPMVAFFQHNIYHYYTADEHTLRVIANAEALVNSPSTFGDVFRGLPSRETLYFACLLHDIAKPERVGDHEVQGVKIAHAVLRRLGADDIADDVLFLIRYHLLMEQVAFRRNLNDPQTILDFAAKFQRPAQLDYLYVLTYADLSAVNKNVWTDWKGMLLTELYQKAHDVLTGKLSAEQLRERTSIKTSAAKEQIVTTLAETLSPEETRRHLDAMESPAYLAAFEAEEIAQHLKAIHAQEQPTVLFKHRNDYTEVTVIAPDAPFALSKFCGVLTANDANIFDANIFTRSDGIIIDKFRVVDDISKSSLNQTQCEKIQQELRDVVRGSTDIEHLLHRHRMRWKRRTHKINPNVRVDVEFEDHPRYTIIDVYAFDTLGFLYRITNTLSRLGLNIAFAKIATRADGIVDSFYVTDLTGSKIDAPERREYVRSELLATVMQLAESELVLS
ncbi:MAG TPA: [protein-PII] uridylyltransferase [Bacteroidota bacterium]|nr:[protein-PII] uridylyltransferase [Bacteroidota bacterium]